MRTDDDAEAENFNSAERRECFAELITHPFRIFGAVCMIDNDMPAVRLGQVALDTFKQCFERSLSAAHLCTDGQLAVIRNIEHRLDRKHRADHRGCIGNSAAALEIIQVIDGEAVHDMQLVLLAPADDFLKGCALLHARDTFADEQTETARNAARIHEIELLIRKIPADALCGAVRCKVRAGHFL